MPMATRKGPLARISKGQRDRGFKENHSNTKKKKTATKVF